MKNLQKLITLIIAVTVFCSCEDTIYPELEEADPQIVIDAWINNAPEPQYIRISETLPYFDSLSNSGIENAAVYIIDNEGGLKIDFVDNSNGMYEWVPTPGIPQIGTIGNSYTLFVEIGGNVYTSTSLLNRVPEIDSITFSYKKDYIYPEGYYAQFYANDFVGPGDTYWIKAYKNGTYLNKPEELSLAFDAGFAAGSNVDGITFLELIRDMINPHDNDAAGDEMPSYTPGDSVFVEIHSINYEAYTYLSELIIQTNRPGGFAELFSVPLANVPTNIVSMGTVNQKPLGFFNMSAVSSLGKWLDPDNLPVSEN
ncbi:DUF4249 domain-containing protein [Bacteroidota bacterium]